MSMNRNRAASLVGVGFRAQKGGAVVIGLVVEKGEPRVLVSTFLPTCADGDRLAFEPYKVATEMALDPKGNASAEMTAAVAEGLRRQEQLATKGLQDIVRHLAEMGCKPVVAALLVNRAGWITDLLAYSLSSPEHAPVAEALAVRDTLRLAAHQCGIELVELDEKSLPDLAAEKLGMSVAEIEARLKVLGADVGRPWRKEQKMACLSAWVAVASQR